MREFLNMATGTSGGASLVGAATGQFILALLTLVFFIGFGAWSSYLRWRDSKAIREALETGDLLAALELRDKAR